MALVAMALCMGSARAAAPANDNFASAQVITGDTFAISGTNKEATKETGEPDHAFITGGASVWFAWTPTVTASVTISTFGSDFDTLLAVYTGTSVSALSSINSSDNGIVPVLTSKVTIFVSAGTTYYIAIDGKSGETGNYKLTLPPPPSNDNLASATVLSGTLVSVTSANIGATRETPNEPTNPINGGGPSVWFDWTAPRDGSVNITTYGSDYDTLSSLYTGADISSLSLILADDDSGPGDLDDKITFTAVSGTLYHIRIEGYSGSVGNIVLTVAYGDGSPNVGNNSPAVANPYNGLTVGIDSSRGGLVTLRVTVPSTLRSATVLNTDFDGVDGRLGSRPSTMPTQQFTKEGVYVATSTAMDSDTGTEKGKGRRSLAISRREVSDITDSTVVDNRTSTAVVLSSIKGKFIFTVDKDTADSVAFKGKIELPEGLDLSQEQTFSIGIGNIIDQVVVTPKGSPKDRSKGQLSRFKSVKLKLPKVDKQTHRTVAHQMADITVSFSLKDMDQLGFDTEGIQPRLLDSEMEEGVGQRNIQVNVLFAGFTWESQLPVEYKVSTKGDSGQFNARPSK